MRLFLIMISSMILSCSHGTLMRCPDQAADNIWHCPDEVEAPYYLCKKRNDILKCEAPK